VPLFRDSHPDLDRFLVLIRVTGEQQAAFAPYQGFVVWGFRGAEAEGNLELALEVGAQEKEEARERAAVIFANWLKRAGIEHQGLPPLTVIKPELMQRQRWLELRMLAKDLHQAAEQHDLAVLVAQTACEVFVEATIADLIRRRKDPLADAVGEMLRGYSLMDDRGRAVWRALTGQRVEQEPFWAHYKAHVKRRNAVAHRGYEVTPEEAAASISAEVALFTYLMAAWVRQL
jgi:hypothetical protein